MKQPTSTNLPNYISIIYVVRRRGTYEQALTAVLNTSTSLCAISSDVIIVGLIASPDTSINEYEIAGIFIFFFHFF